jgi:hypothetical protein
MRETDMEARRSGQARKTTRSGLAALIIAALVVTLALPSQAGATLSFQRITQQFAPGNAPNSIATGFLNGDPVPDIAGTNGGADTISVAVFDINAGYQLTDYATGDAPSATAVGDVNGDGNQDVVVANTGSDNVTILLGDGSGALTEPAYSPIALPPGSGPDAVVIAETQNDPDPEIVTANGGSNSVTELFPVPGGFTVGAPIPVGQTPSALAVADLNGDGNPGLVTVNADSGDITVLIGDGMGSFVQAPGSPIAVGPNPTALAVGQLNGDSIPDLAVTNASSKYLTLLLGDGTARFTEAPSSPVALGGENPTSIVLADLNGDGDEEIATANNATSDVSVLAGDGHGNFSPEPGSPFPTGVAPTDMAVTDFSQDGVPDLVTVSPSTDSVTALINRGWPRLVATPADLAFDDQRPGTIGEAKTVTVTNTGHTGLHISLAHTMGDNSDDFLISGGNCTTEAIAVGDSCQVGLRFAPSELGPRTAMMAFHSDSPGPAVMVPLSGTGAVPPPPPSSPGLSLAPTGLTFPDELVTTMGKRLTVSVTNSGTTDLSVSGIYATGEDAGDFMVSSGTCADEAIPAGQTCEVGVRFAPSGRGLRTATLKLDSNASTSPDTITMSGTGGVAPRAIVAPSLQGSTTPGRLAGCSIGQWSGTRPRTYTRQWVRDATPIPGATNKAYRVRAVDAGHRLRCRVTVSNSVGHASLSTASVMVPNI